MYVKRCTTRIYRVNLAYLRDDMLSSALPPSFPTLKDTASIYHLELYIHNYLNQGYEASMKKIHNLNMFVLLKVLFKIKTLSTSIVNSRLLKKFNFR